MALKTFNVDAEAYKKFSDYCKKEGISMSKKVEKFIKEELERLNPEKVERKVEKFVERKVVDPAPKSYIN